MLDLVIAIIGGEDTTYNNAADNLDDLLPENCLVYIPSYKNSSGLRVVSSWLEQTTIDFKRLRKSLLVDKLIEHKAGVEEPSNVALVVLGTTGIEQDIEKAFQDNIPVLDLTRGLYPVTEADFAAPLEESQMPLDGSESHAKTLSGPTGTQTKGSPVEAADERYSGWLEHDVIVDIARRLEGIEQEVKKIMTQVSIGETNWEPDLTRIAEPKTGLDVIKEDPGLAEAAGLIAYYKSKRGKLRKAGNSKARPGETLVYLTQEEIETIQ